MKHQWLILAREFERERARCKRCETVRIRVTGGEKTPQSQYCTREGKVTHLSPPCAEPKG